MPWAERNLVSLREEFVRVAETTELTMSELCRRFGLSRKTGYKWVGRYRAEGRAGLRDRSRRPQRVRFQVPPATREFLVAERQRHPAWGARKLRHRAQQQGLPAVPACSTITTVLHREGLIGPECPPGQRAWQRFEHPVPNSLWQMDFKGPVKTLAGPVHPLTVLDDHSRYNLGLQVLPNQRTGPVQAALITIFRRYGLPNRLLMDNGSPWGDTADQPDTTLTVWLLQLGVRLSHSRPYHPQTVGKEERFHGTLTREVLRQAQWQDGHPLQDAFDRWRQVYNHERPHEALALAVPASRYQPSLRVYPETLPPLEYDPGVVIRKVQQKGEVHFRGRVFEVSRAFRGYPVGLSPTTEDGVYEIRFGHHRIKTIDIRIYN